MEIFVKNGTYGVNMCDPKSHLLSEGEHDCCGRAGMSKGLGSGQCVPCVAGGFGGAARYASVVFVGALNTCFCGVDDEMKIILKRHWCLV